MNFLFVIKSEREFVGAGLKSERSICDYEKSLLADFQFVVARAERSQNKAPCAVGFCSGDLTGSVLKFYLRGAERNAVFIDYQAGAGGGIGRAHWCGCKSDNANETDEC